MSATAFAARTRLPATCVAGVVEERLESVRHRWNQFGLEAQVDVAGGEDGILVSYRLTVAGRPDAAVVHAAFRDDLDGVLAALTAPAPATWDLAAMARAAVEAAPAVRWTVDADAAV